MRENILDYEILKDVEVQVPRFDRLKAVAGSLIFGAGAVGELIGTMIEAHKNKKLDFKIIDSNSEKGVRCKMRYKKSNNEIGEIIYCATAKERDSIWLEDLVLSSWKQDTQVPKESSGSGCMLLFLTLFSTTVLFFSLIF